MSERGPNPSIEGELTEKPHPIADNLIITVAEVAGIVAKGTGVQAVDAGSHSAVMENLAYNSGDFGPAAALSWGIDILLRTQVLGKKLPPRARRMISFLTVSGIVYLTEVVMPQGFVGNVKDIHDIPAGIIGAAIPHIPAVVRGVSEMIQKKTPDTTP